MAREEVIPYGVIYRLYAKYSDAYCSAVVSVYCSGSFLLLIAVQETKRMVFFSKGLAATNSEKEDLEVFAGDQFWDGKQELMNYDEEEFAATSYHFATGKISFYYENEFDLMNAVTKKNT